MFSAILNPFAIFISLTTATGILVHDTHIDAATSTALSMPAVIASHDISNKLASLGGDAHTHVERGAAAQAVINLQSKNPRIDPRVMDGKKYFLQKRVVRGYHAFDNYNLPII